MWRQSFIRGKRRPRSSLIWVFAFRITGYYREYIDIITAQILSSSIDDTLTVDRLTEQNYKPLPHLEIKCWRNRLSGHMIFIQRRIIVDATLSRFIDVDATLSQRRVLAGVYVNEYAWIFSRDVLTKKKKKKFTFPCTSSLLKGVYSIRKEFASSLGKYNLDSNPHPAKVHSFPLNQQLISIC